MALVEVAHVDELSGAEPLVVRAGRRELALVKWREEIYAVHNLCPHMSASFACGTVVGRVSGTVGAVTIDKQEPVITCPWHRYEFALADGRCPTDAGLRLRTYRVLIEDSRVFIDLTRHRQGAPPS